MSGSGAARLGPIDGSGLRVAIVAASWHDDVMAGLIAGATAACTDAGAASTVVRVPGAFELPIAAAACADAGYDAVVALGAVVRGGTPHFDYVCDAATAGLTQVAVASRTPVGFGLLTCDSVEQALDRAGLPGSSEDKGREATEAAIATALVLRDLPTP